MVVDAVVETFGPFLIPAVLFVLGGLAYGLLVVLARRGQPPEETGTDPDPNPDRTTDGTDDAGRND